MATQTQYALGPFATYVTWQEFTGTRSTVEELRKELGKLPKLQFIHACALTNIILRTWQGNIDLDQYEQLLKAVFSPEFSTQLDKLARHSDPPRFVFHRQQLLFLIKEAAVYCADEREDLGGEFNAAFAKCCLRANDLLQYGLALDENLPRVERLLPEMVTINDYTYRESILRKVARTRIILEDILSRPHIRARPEFVDIPGLFLTMTGLTFHEYSNLAFGTLAKYMKLTLADYARERNAFILSARYFSPTPVDPAKVERFLADIGVTFAELKKACSSITNKNDFTPMRDRPLLTHNDGKYIAVDTGFVADKLETGLFWRVSQVLATDEERERLHTFWGHLFDEYVTNLLTNVCENSPNRCLPHPEFEGGGEACDAIIVCGSNAVFLEFKGSILTGNAKYSGLPELLTKELALKFVGTDAKPKGIRQLARTICKCGAKKGAQGIVGLGKVAKVFPVLIARDGSLASPLVNHYLNVVFKPLYNRKMLGPVVAPLFVLSLDELEELSGFLVDTRFDEILESRYKGNRSMSLPFSAVRNELLLSKGERTNYLLEKKFNDIIDQTCRDLFGKSLGELEAKDVVEADPPTTN